MAHKSRENQRSLNGNYRQSQRAVNLTYQYRGDAIRSRISLFTQQFRNGVDINYFYVDGGFGSGIRARGSTAIDENYWVEGGLTYDTDADIELSLHFSFLQTCMC